ncbi:hypothetical protein [Geodermatophilus sp. DSM 44513]|uniref:hypothetical protein n=1 Tax=Geodermatophilus sp. DSM 44513 TaxID=1528104 RepID=UPI001279B06B|nr:hypothetical protein [Geodermatophilus sp. DSM 44513]WNV74138.1 hypothetical protein RTG05_14195 [Geodermatophilus sp. DSM 44513]
MSAPALTQAPVHSPLALTHRWATLLAPSVFDRRSLWLTWFRADGRQLPLVMPGDEMPARPDGHLLPGLREISAGVAAHVPGDVVHLAMALCRPGEPAVTRDDEAWALAAHAVLDDGLDGSWSLHLAAGGRVEPLVEGFPARRDGAE